jgi:hypothetical protein
MREKYTITYAFIFLFFLCTNTLIYFSFLPTKNNLIPLVAENPSNGLREFYVYPMYRSLPNASVLSSNAGNPDIDGVFSLNWTVSTGANNYSVYEYSRYITEINGSLTLLTAEITDLGLDLSGYTDGTYYFIVVAHNNDGSTLSNCISVTVVIPPDHDLDVSIELPTSIDVNTSYIVIASVKNTGLNSETFVQLYLYLDKVLVNSTIIPSLAVGQKRSIQYNWTPSEYRSYNFTAYAPPVTLETYLDNNVKTVFVYLVSPNWLDGLYIEYFFGQIGAGYNSQFSYTPYVGGLYNVTFEIEEIDTYVWQIDPKTRIMHGDSLFGDGAHTPVWIFTNTSLYDTIPIAVGNEGDHNFYVARDLIYDLPGFGLINVWELEDLTEPGGIAWYEKSTGILINGTFIYGGGINYDLKFIDTNAVFSYIVNDHEIRVTLDIPLNANLNTTYLVKAKIENNGLYDELGVDLFLYLNDILVNSTTISNLGVGMSYTIQYSWTPTNYGEYNFTAFAPIVPSESYIENNRKTTIIYIVDTNLFDGLYIKYIFSSFYNSTVTYHNYNGRLFYETFERESMEIFGWTVDSLTRKMSGYTPFGTYPNAGHTPFWIFTNVSLYETVPIAVLGEGDHNFTVTQELIIELPGFGPVEVWELEDLTVPGVSALYEKSTGILLNANFGYTVNFVDTNAAFNIVFMVTSNAGDPDTDGNFNLMWTPSPGANNYSVYEYSSYITEINGSLTSLATEISYLSLALNGYTDGTYYFIVVAHKNEGDILSNCIKITVEIVPPPGDFTLSSTADSPDKDGNFGLTWTASSGADSYTVYQSANNITEISGKIIIKANNITVLSIALNDYTDGTYYFIVVAHNARGDTLSNCISVTVLKPEVNQGIPGYDDMILVAALGVTIAIVIKKKYQKK